MTARSIRHKKTCSSLSVSSGITTNSIVAGAVGASTVEHHGTLSSILMHQCLLVLQCCDWYPYFERYTIPWDTQKVKKLVRLAEEARKYCIEVAEKNRRLQEIGSLIRKSDEESTEFHPRLGIFEVMDIGRSPTEEFMVLSPSRKIGYRLHSSVYFTNPSENLEESKNLLWM